MRLRTGSVESVGESPARGGRRFSFPKIWRSPRAQTGGKQSASPAAEQPLQEAVEEQEQQPPAILTFSESLEGEQYSECSRLLIMREERLFEGKEETETLKDHEEERAKLAEEYKKLEAHILRTLNLSFSQESLRNEALTSATKAIVQEVEQDKRWKQRSQALPPWRSNNWRSLHDKTLRSLVEQRMDEPHTPPCTQVKQSSVQIHINSMGLQLKVDLLSVVEVLKPCYPPGMDICNIYARLYHQSFGARLRKISEFGLDDKDCTAMLCWVNQYYPGILQQPELVDEISVETLGKLLPDETLTHLEEQFLSSKQEELTTYIGRILEEANQKWQKGEEPTSKDGCFVSTVAYDIIQCIHSMVTMAGNIVGNQHNVQKITSPLKELMERFKTFQNNVIKQNRPNSSSFVKANLSCIEQFSDVLSKQRKLFSEDVREECLPILRDMRQSAHAYLLKPVHDSLKPLYRKLGTSDWLNNTTFEMLLASIERELQALQGSSQSCHQKLIGQLHQEVTSEYVARLLKGELKLKNKEMQLKAYETVKDNAESLHDLFNSMGSNEEWLKEILTKIAEVLKLQDLPAIQMHVASMATIFPDLSVRHVSALLKLKTNFSRADRRNVKETLAMALSETSFDCIRPFFSSVSVK